jgi:hypothetical protein
MAIPSDRRSDRMLSAFAQLVPYLEITMNDARKPVNKSLDLSNDARVADFASITIGKREGGRFKSRVLTHCVCRWKGNDFLLACMHCSGELSALLKQIVRRGLQMQVALQVVRGSSAP